MRNSFRFGALVAALALCGCAGVREPPPPPPPPPPPHDHPNAVTLQVQSGPSGYVCTFSGGDDHNGNVTVSHSEGDVNIHVNLNAAPNFALYSFSFKDDDGQLRYKIEPGDVRAVIHDANSGTMDAYYGVLVADKSTNPNPDKAAKALCDPRIINN